MHAREAVDAGVRACPWYPLDVLVEEALFLLDAARDAARSVGGSWPTTRSKPCRP